MAIPANFAHAFQRIDHSGTVHVRLTWMSSEGTLNNLSDCEFREEVTYTGPPSPAFDWNPPNPTHGQIVSGARGVAPDIHIMPAIKTPRQAGTLTALQHYQYRCPDTGGRWTDVPGHFYSITREVISLPRRGHPPQWVYRIRKQSRVFGGFNFENQVILP